VVKNEVLLDMKFSIVTTLFQSASYINEFYERTTATAKRLVGDDYEIVFVNDGSPDNSLDLVIRLTEQDSKVVTVDLSRNFGHHKAMMTGLRHSKGEYVFLIDSDLEERPEWLETFESQMKHEQCDVVYGVQDFRKGNGFERWSGQVFYLFSKMLTGIDLPKNVVTSRLMKRCYVDALLLHQEREVFLLGLWHISGFDQRPQVIKKLNSSETTYTIRRKISLLINSVTSFSNAPLISIFYIGITISLFSLAFNVYLIFQWAYFETILSGWTSVMASIWLIGGMIISFIGVVGLYLSKVYSETKQRPYTIVKKVYAKKQD